MLGFVQKTLNTFSASAYAKSIAHLPPGPHEAPMAQMLAYAQDPVATYERAHAEFGDVFTTKLVGGAPAVHLADPAARPLDPAKFRDPFVTAKGEPRARVALARLATLWINTGTLCNLACRSCYIESSPVNDALVYPTLAEIAPYLDEAAALGAREMPPYLAELAAIAGGDTVAQEPS